MRCLTCIRAPFFWLCLTSRLTQDGAEASPKDIGKMPDSASGELQRLKNKLQNVNSTISQHERKISVLERNLASSQNLARQREEEINRLQDRMYEHESDARRKIEKLTTYTQNLCKAIEKKEQERDEKKAEIHRLHKQLDEKEKEIQRSKEETKDVRVDSRKQLLVVENERRKSVEAYKASQAELSLTQTDTSKRIAFLEAENKQRLDAMEELEKAIKLRDIQIEALNARQLEMSGGNKEVKSQLNSFVNKAIEADKQAVEYKNKLREQEAGVVKSHEHIKSLKKSKLKMETLLRETLNNEAALQKHLDRALRDLHAMTINVAQLEKEKVDNETLVAVAHKQNSALEESSLRKKNQYEQDTEERDTKITTLISKVSIAEMREEHLLKQVHEVEQARDILFKDLHRCRNELYGSQGEHL